MCPVGCVVARPHPHAIDPNTPMPKRGQPWSEPGPGECSRDLPYAGWELVLRERVRAVRGDDAAVAAQWGVAGMLSDQWSDYGERYGEGGGGLVARWGSVDDPGRETTSEAGAQYEHERLTNLSRIADMKDALNAFSATVQSDPKFDPNRTNAAAASLIGLVAVATMQDDTTERRAAIDRFYAEQHWEWISVLGGAACRVLVNAIVRRGGSYEGTAELLSYAEIHDTEFGSYRHALWWAFYVSTNALGEGSPLAGLGSAEYEHALPSGINLSQDVPTIHPTRNRSSTARNEYQRTRKRDVWACIGAARIGGLWERRDPTEPDRPLMCEGGRRVTAWELELVKLCDVGTEVESATRQRGKSAQPDYDWRRLSIPEAVQRVQQLAREERDDPSWAGARHLRDEDARASLTKARRAITDALVAWDMIPPREPKRAEYAAPEDPERPPRHPKPVVKQARTHATWDAGVSL